MLEESHLREAGEKRKGWPLAERLWLTGEQPLRWGGEGGQMGWGGNGELGAGEAVKALCREGTAAVREGELRRGCERPRV